jgi:ferredoxin-type protein NapG
MLDYLKNKMTTRRYAIKSIAQGAGYLALGGLFWGQFLEEDNKVSIQLRPPGALPENDFTKACVKCGLCVEACPYDTLKLAKNNDNNNIIGTPYFEPREVPCYMCTDIPCVPVCPSDALSIDLVSSINEKTKKQELDINKSKMGLAVIHKETCVAFWGVQCDACYRACPLMDEAIFLEYEQNERTGKHANLKPVINTDICTGCGLCEHACITEVSAVKVLPEYIASGKVGDHYIKGWDDEDEDRLKNNISNKKSDDDIQSALDYLNEDNLFDEE